MKRKATVVLPLLLVLWLVPACGVLEVGVEPTDTPPVPGTPGAGPPTEEATPGGGPPPTETAAPEPGLTPIYGPFVLHVVFVRDGDVWLWTEDREAVPLTTGGGVGSVRISGDGAVVAFTRVGELWAVNRDGTGERLLVSAEALATMERRQPDFGVVLHRYAWVARTHTLAFNTRLDTDHGVLLNDDLYLVDADTLEQTLLFPPLQGGEFTFSPDGSRVALARPDGIFLADADGANLTEALRFTPVATASEFQYYPEPVWAADADSLRVAIAPPDPYVERPRTSIWALRADGTAAHMTGSVEAAPGSQPVFSASLSQLAYLQLPEGGGPGAPTGLVLTDLTGDGSVGGSTVYYPGAHAFYGYAPDSLRFAFLTDPDRPRAMLGQLGAEPVPALEEAGAVVIDVRWVGGDRYLLLATNSAGGWDILLGGVGGPVTHVAAVAGPPPVYDFAR